MWARSDEEGYEACKTGSSSSSSSGWLSGYESPWPNNQFGSENGGGLRRHSTASDSGDTGIGTYCSDSVEDNSSSSTTPSSFHPSVQGVSLPFIPSSSSYSDFSKLSLPGSPCNSSSWRSCQLGAVEPMRRSSSLTRLSSGPDQNLSTSSGYRCGPDSHGSLDRRLLHGCRRDSLSPNTDVYLPLSSSSSLSSSSMLRSPGADPFHLYRTSIKSRGLGSDRSLPSPLKHRLDISCRASPEAELLHLISPDPSPGHQAGRGSAVQPDLRTQMWLTEQMAAKAKLDPGGELGQTGATRAEDCGNMLSPWQQEHQHQSGCNQMRDEYNNKKRREEMLWTSLPVSSLVKVKEGLLRQKELEINRQKQQILQLHVRIRENELRAQQVLQRSRSDELYILNTKESAACRQLSDLCCDTKELSRKLAVAEVEVFHLKESLKQVTLKYAEDIRKLEEKMKTRDRYISSLKKKCKREAEQNQEKQQRIETLEKYLADLPTVEEVQTQAQQLEEVQRKADDLEDTVSRLEENVEEGRALKKEKDELINTQADRERELITSVQSLQVKVRRCLEDGVRLPVLDLKQLEVENTLLLEQQNHSSRLIEEQKEKINWLTSELTVVRRGDLSYQLLGKEDSPPPPSRTFSQQEDEGPVGPPGAQLELPESGRLLREMSLCLLELQALCSILTQRSQGQEPNLSLLLGVTSMNLSAEESGVDQELRVKLLEVGKLRRDIDDLRKSVSDCYSQWTRDSCVSL